MNTKFLLLAVVLGCALAEEKTSYEGFKLIDIFPESQAHFDLLAELEHSPDFDLWSRVRQGPVKASLSPSAFEKYQIIFQLFKLKFTISHHNIQEIFDEEQRQMKKREINDRQITGLYARHADINSWILKQVSENPTLASSYVAGSTQERRDLRVIVLKTTTSKRKIWIDCGIHAREWVSPSTCVWIIDKFIKEYKSNDATVRALLAHFEIHVLPVVNPDGYEFSHTNTRLWRKNRKTNSGSTCVGVDLNRNYGFQWMTGGSSNLPCSDTYAGPSRDSELETQAVEKSINAYRGQWDSFITIHSYGKWWFTPYGYTANTLPSDFTELDSKAKIGVAALQATYNEKNWVTGSSAKILYVASGGSDDWAYGNAGIKYSYCLELRPGDKDADYSYGFTLPESRAPLAGEETYRGIKAFLNSIKP